MLTAEFNLDEYKKVMRNEALKEGRAEGFEQGLEQGIEKGIEQGEKRVNYLLELMEQGLSYEEIKKKLEKTKKQRIRDRG